MARKKKRDAEEIGFADEAAPERVRLTPVEIQQKVFRLAFRGYNERDVDEFLDRVTEDLAALHEENKRLREGVGDPGQHGGVEAAQRQAEQIVRQAREHAARLLEDAERGDVSPAAGGLPTAFLLGERAFLQRLAQAVQEHARWLKQEARRSRPAEATNEPAEEATAADRPTAAVAPEPEPEAPPMPPPPAEEPPGPVQEAAAPVAGAASATGPEEQTAAWGPPQEGMAEPPDGWTQEAPAAEADPLLSAWESAFTDSGSAPPEQGGAPPEKEGEPSLRELFWGDE